MQQMSQGDIVGESRATYPFRGRLSEYRCRLPGLRHFSAWLEISFRVSAASCC
jgi:hypothetical protein